MYVDDSLAWKQQMGSLSGTHVCGNTAKEEFVPVSVTLAHYAQGVRVRVQSGLSSESEDESWGIANFKITTALDNCTGITYQSDFVSDGTAGWDITNALIDGTTMCGDETVLGGLKSFGIGAKASLDIDLGSTGLGLIVAFTFLQIDSWYVFCSCMHACSFACPGW